MLDSKNKETLKIIVLIREGIVKKNEGTLVNIIS